MSSEVTAILKIFNRNNPDTPVTTDSGSKTTMEQAVDNVIIVLRRCDPTLGDRLSAGSGT